MGRCKSNMTNHHNQQILSTNKGKHNFYGLHNFTQFIENTCYQTIRGRSVKTRKYMPTIIPVVSVGHHVPDLNGHELMDLLVLLKGNISLIRQVTIIPIIPLCGPYLIITITILPVMKSYNHCCYSILLPLLFFYYAYCYYWFDTINPTP